MRDEVPDGGHVASAELRRLDEEGPPHVLELRAGMDAAVDRVHRFNVRAHAPPDVAVGGLLVLLVLPSS